jgi:hypothetical protein
MAIILNGDTGISSIGALSGVTSISATNAALTGITSVASNAADTPVILQDSSSNSATCRAWVNFNGTGTVAIRADFNVSSITDGGVGIYTVNFTNAMPDSNYCVTCTGVTSGSNTIFRSRATTTQTASATQVVAQDQTNVFIDVDFGFVAIFR